MDTTDKIGDLQSQGQQPNGGGPKQIVHVRGDSETELDLLFSVLNSRDNNKPSTRSFRDMNLPLSFFRPPDPKPPGCHSRDGSLDGSVGVVPGGQQFTAGAGLQPSGGAGLNVFHSRSHSSPAQLPLSLSVAPSPGGHLKQGSADGGAIDTGSRQPPQPQQTTAWATANNQQAPNNNFFMNTSNGLWPSDSQCKTGGLPAQGMVVSSPNKQQNRGTNIVQNGHPGVTAPPVSAAILQNLGPLPKGWEQGVTPEGDIYYINHIEKTTSWFDPRIPKHMQKPVPVKASTAHNRHSQQQQQQQQPQQQAHIVQQQLPSATLASQLRPPAGANIQAARPPGGLSHNEQLIRHELLKLQKEKERLRREQEDAERKEQMLLKELTKLKCVHPAAQTPVTASAVDGVMSGLMAGAGGLMLQQQMVSSGVDPFLGQSDSHGRQNSNDAGLGIGNMGPGFVALRNPEELFNNLDSMDTHESLHKSQGLQQQQTNDLSQLPQCLPGIDVPLLGDSGDQLGMDSDDLVSSLTDDLAMNMDVQMMENIIQYI